MEHIEKALVHFKTLLQEQYKRLETMDKPRKVNQYTKEGRAYIHENVSSVNMNIVHYLMRHPVIGESVEYNDNRISLYIAQKGRCAAIGFDHAKAGDAVTRVDSQYPHYAPPRNRLE